MTLSTIFSIVHLLIAVPTLTVGIIIGAAGYGFLLKRYPSLLASLVQKATDEVQLVVSEVAAKAIDSKVPTTAATPSSTTPAAGS